MDPLDVHDRATLWQESCDDVARQIPKEGYGAGLADVFTSELIGSLVRIGIDAALTQFGPTITEWTLDKKAVIRQFASSQTLTFLENLAAGLQTLKAAHS